MADILVTRPAGQAADLCAGVAAAGHTAHHLPLLEVQPLARPSATQRQQLLDLDLYQHIIFVSGNAVRWGMQWIESFWPQLPVGINWYAVGEGTARQLAEFGIAALVPDGAMTSEGLLALPPLREVADQRVLIIKGEGGRQALAAELGARGARVDELACYRRSAPQLAPGELAGCLVRWRIALVMISSGEGLANLLALLSPAETSKFVDITVLVPSPRVAELARKAGFRRVMIADNASDSAMLSALSAWNPSAGE
jgi:uroporphyrinogen-III synthase